VPGAVDVRRVLRFGHIIKPVSPAQAARPLLRLHHHVSHSGEGHVAAYLPAKFLIALHARIKQLNQPQAKAPLAAKLLDLPGQIDPEHRHHAGFVAV